MTEQRPLRNLRSGMTLPAAERLLSIYADLALRGQNALDCLLAGTRPVQWEHYPMAMRSTRHQATSGFIIPMYRRIDRRRSSTVTFISLHAGRISMPANADDQAIFAIDGKPTTPAEDAASPLNRLQCDGNSLSLFTVNQLGDGRV